ncbi:MAG: hypothetical protein K0V04_36580 [Deltaproteobacteria bacterium]|nr:hypothetical protein [Deltaproteobacteria bacterium]
MHHFVRLAVGCLLPVACACTGSQVYQCEADVGCALDGSAGVCQPNGYCSFDDPSCDSGQRYGEYAPQAVAQTCVPIVEDTDDPSSDVTTTHAGSTGPSVDSGSVLTGSSSDDGRPPPPPATTGDSSSTGSATSAADTGPPPCSVFADDFEDGVIDPLWNVAQPENSTEIRGQLMMSNTPANTTDATGIQLFDVDVSAATIAVELGILPTDPVSQISLILLTRQLHRMSMVVSPTTLGLRQGAASQDEDTLLAVPFDPIDHRWLRFETAEPMISFQASPDGLVWTNLLTVDMPAGWSLVQGRVDILTTNWNPLLRSDTVSVESFAWGCGP